MSLDQKDLEAIEQMLYRHGDDLAVSVARSFERIEERIDDGEVRLSGHLADVEAKIDIVVDSGNDPNNHD